MRSVDDQIGAFMAEANDRPGGAPARSYILCSSPRTGSNMLARALIDTGRAGMPFEYLNPMAMAAYVRRLGVASLPLERYVAFLLENRAPGGVFGLKAHFHQFATVYADRDAQRATLARFDAAVFLRRRNRLRQAISEVRAAMSGTWFADGPGHAEAARDAALRYDAAAIARSLGMLVADDEGWNTALATMARPALVLYYEDVVANIAAALRAVSDHVGLDLAVPDGLAPRTVNLGDATNAAWEARFRCEVLGA